MIQVYQFWLWQSPFEQWVNFHQLFIYYIVFRYIACHLSILLIKVQTSECMSHSTKRFKCDSCSYKYSCFSGPAHRSQKEKPDKEIKLFQAGSFSTRVWGGGEKVSLKTGTTKCPKKCCLENNNSSRSSVALVKPTWWCSIARCGCALFKRCWCSAAGLPVIKYSLLDYKKNPVLITRQTNKRKKSIQKNK